jgi:hypothetical protein
MSIRFVYHKSKAMSDAEELMSLNVIKTDISFGLMNGSIIISLINFVISF